MSETEESREIRCFACNWAEERTTFLSDIKALQDANDNLRQYILRLQDEILSLEGKLDEVPDIVRCKDCKWSYHSELFPDINTRYCRWFMRDVYIDMGFCFWRLRKDDEDDA